MVGVFTWAGVVPLFTGLLFVAALLQSCVMRGQLAEMKAARKSGDISTASQLDMMNKQAIAMQGQLDVMKTDQRPWVGLRGIDNIPNSSAKMLVFSNGGKAPAMNASVFVSGVSEGDDTLVIPEAACESTCTFRGIELLPNVPLAVRVPRVGQPDPTADIPFWLVARIDYVDSEGHPHKTGICFRIMPDAGHSITDCPAPNSNYAD